MFIKTYSFLSFGNSWTGTQAALVDHRTLMLVSSCTEARILMYCMHDWLDG